MLTDNIDEALRMATLFGETVRTAEDAGNEKERASARADWTNFRDTFTSDKRVRIVEAYWDSYCKLDNSLTEEDQT